LTERQWTIARLVAKKLKNQQIAAMVQFSERTVENELTAMYHLLNLEGRRQLADWYQARSAPTDAPTRPAAPRRRG
jgi:DNA-binding NarL/FixJ family response regulator